ncbi:MAG: tetrahydrofolate synthase, partial [Spirochaetales bacterium]|nr:tetrahydrofolate synthase [Spirochaetales bacterium]
NKNKLPPLFIDGAHTKNSVKAAVAAFYETIGNKSEDCVLIFGAVKGKDVKSMAEILCPQFKKIIISKPGHFKPNNPKDVFDIFTSIKTNSELFLLEDPQKALDEAIRTNTPVFVTGSFYMVAEIRNLIEAL